MLGLIFISKRTQLTDMYIALDEAKKHLNVDDIYTEDDNYIIHLIMSAEDATAKRLNAPLHTLVDPHSGYLPESVKHQILLLVGSWYAARETFSNQTVSALPHSYDFLADLNKNYKSTF